MSRRKEVSMPIVYLQEFDGEPGDRSTTGYDTVKENMNITEPPEGLIVHTAGFDGDVFRIVDVWETEAHFTKFRDERLMPAVEKMMAERPSGGPPARESTYELHDILPA
jgi:heme-degrading monooxygenase HmoA